MRITYDEAKMAVEQIKSQFCTEGCVEEIENDCSFDVYLPIENTGVGIHSASNGEIIRLIMYFKDAESGHKDIHAYVEEDVVNMSFEDFYYALPELLWEMSDRLEHYIYDAMMKKESRN